MSGVKIPISLNKEKLKEDAKAVGKDLLDELVPVVDVVDLVKGGWELLGSAMGKVAGIAQESIARVVEQERAEFRLMQALRRRGAAHEDLIERLNEDNAARSRLTGTDGELQQALQAQALDLGVNANALSRVTDAALGLAHVTGQSLESAFESAIKVYHGKTKALEKLGFQFRDSIDLMDQLVVSARESEQMNRTTTKSWELLGEAIQDFWDGITSNVIRNDELRGLIDDVKDGIVELTGDIGESGPQISSFFSSMLSDLRELGRWIRENKSELQLLASVMTAPIKVAGLASAAAGKLDDLTGGLGSAGKWQALANVVPGLGAVVSAGSSLSAIARGAQGDDVTTEPLPPEPELPPPRTVSGFEFVGPQIAPEELEKRREAAEKEEEKRAKLAEEERKKRIKAEQEFERTQTSEYYALARRMADDAEKEKRERADAIRKFELEAKDAHNKAQAEKEREGLRMQTLIADEKNAALRTQIEKEKHLREIARAQEAQFQDQARDIAIGGFAGIVSGLVAQAGQGEIKLGQAAKRMFGGMLQQFGSMLMTMGTATVAAATASTPVPMLWGLTGGPAGVGAGLAMVAVGAGLTGAGSALVASASEARKASGHVQQRARDFQGASRRDETGAQSAMGGEGSRVINVVNVAIDGGRGIIVGSSAEIADMLESLLRERTDLQFAT